MNDFFLALRFLTVLPWGGSRPPDTGELVRSLNYYSLVGLLLGGALALVSLASSAHGLGLSGDVLVVAVQCFLTGGLHLDGLADTADGVFSSRSREKKLEIMRDSRIGTMGAVALWVVLMLKTALLGDLGAHKVLVLWWMPALGRGAMVLAAVCFSYARPGGGLGSFTQEAGAAALLVNGGVIVASGTLLLGVKVLAVTAVVLVAAYLLAAALARSLGGLTGDTFGAVCELSETFTLLLAAGLGW